MPRIVWQQNVTKVIKWFLLDPSFTVCAKLQPLCASLTDVFLDAIAKAKKLICKSIA